MSTEQKLTGYPSIDKPWLKYYECEFNESNIPNMSIFQLIERENSNNLEEVAIDIRSSKNDFCNGVKITYQQYFDEMNAAAKSLKFLGIKADEIIPILLPNILEARVLIYATSIVGATAYPISPMLPTNQLEVLICENNISTIFIFKDFFEKYKESINRSALKNIIILDGSESLSLSCTHEYKNSKNINTDSKITSWSDFIKNGETIKDKLIPYYREGHIAAIIGTSGTTGISKGVCLTDKNVNAAACAYRDGKVYEGTFMDALLPSIGYGISMMHYQTITGKYVYLIPELLTLKFPEAVSKINPDNFPGGPVHYLNLRASELFKSGNVVTGKNYISGGASLPKDVEKELNGINEDYEEKGTKNNSIIVRQGYGLSENVAIGTYSKFGSYKFGSIGIPMPYLTFGIFEPSTDTELKYYEKGEICITGPTVMQGYLNRQDETDKVIKTHSDGRRWIHTQDIAFMDESGHVFHVDRVKNIFMRTGFNVHPSKIAEFINTIPYVSTSVVIGFEHPEEQCVPVAFVVINEDLTKNMTDEAIKAALFEMCYSNLEETSIPYDFIITNFLPINVGGKIDIIRIKQESGINYLENNSKSSSRLYFIN